MYSKFLLLYSTLSYFAGVSVHGQFSTLPSSTTVAVGGDASFECTLSSGGQVAWSIRRGVVQLAFIVTNASDVSGIEVHQALLGSNGSPLVLKGVGQSMDGVGVFCAASGTTFSDAAILTALYPPNITAPPTELSPSNHSPCCSAVKLNLAEPGRVSSVGVSLSTGGGPFEVVDSGDASLDGDVLYVSGLQAGAVYVAKITASNAIGSSSTLKALVPLLGTPSAPTMVIVAAGTSVSVVMATSHPGTFTGRIGSMLLFQVEILENGRLLRTELVTVTALSLNVTTAIYNGILDPGSYSVKVTAVNEYGRSSAVKSEEFTLEDSSQVNIIVLAVIVVVLSLAFLAVCVYSVVVTVKRKHGLSLKPPQQEVKSEPVYAGMEMESHPVDIELKMESNPAYSTTEGVKKATSNKTAKDQSIPSAGGEVEYI